MATSVFDDLLTQAKEAEKTLRATLAGFTAEKQPHLSDLGRKQFQDQARDAYQRKVAGLKEQYAGNLELESAKVKKAAEAARVADFERRRAMLGDVAMVHIYERRLASMDGEQLRAALAEASPGYERALVQELGGAILSERMAKGENTGDLFRAANEYRQPTTPELAALREKERDLVTAERNQAKLDPVAWKVDTASRFGVSAQHMEMPS